METKDLIIGLAVLIGLIIFIVDKVSTHRTINSLTAALKDAKNDPQIVGQLNSLATGVVPVEALYKGYDVMLKLAAFAKALTPDDVDAAIDAGTDLVGKVINPNSLTPDPAFVAALPIEKDNAVG